MKKAATVSEIPNSFKPTPLEAADMKEFYEDTMAVRTGCADVSPIEDIYESCHKPEDRNAFLLMGHMGCGKSTELNRLAERLKKDGYPVKTIYCKKELDSGNMEFSDVLILMADALLQLSDETGRIPDRDDMELIRTFWTRQGEEEKTVSDGAGAELYAEAGAGVNYSLGVLLKMLTGIKTSLKYNVESRTVYRDQIIQRNSQWLDAVNRVAERLTTEDGKQPILIFEDLDKGNTWNVFSGHCEQLTGVDFPVIYTFPIAFSYRPTFREMESFFNVNRLPMIKTRTIDGDPNDEGLDIIRDIVTKRAEASLFEEDVLEKLIDKTGGSLRDLFQAISKAAILSRRRRLERVNMDSADFALEEIKSWLSSRIEGDEHRFLTEIYLGKHREIEERDKLLNMMLAGTVLEYNGKRWYNVHPLIADYLNEIKWPERYRKMNADEG